MFVSPLQGTVTKKKGWKSNGGERQRGSFNVCLPREAIKINTSNYQAVLNFLGATSPGTLPLYSPLPPSLLLPTSRARLFRRPPLLRSALFPRNSVPLAGNRPTRRISLHSRAFYFQRVLQLRTAEAFLNFKGEKAVLKMQERRQEPLLPALFLFSPPSHLLHPTPSSV